MKRELIIGLVFAAALGCATTPSTPDAAPAEVEPLDRSVLPKGGPAPDFTPPPIQRATLSNGLKVMVAENHELPLVGFFLSLDAGSAVDPTGKEGLASLTATALSRGAGDMDALALSDAFKQIGSGLGTGASLDEAHVVVVTLKKHEAKALGLMSAAKEAFGHDKVGDMEPLFVARYATYIREHEKG